MSSRSTAATRPDRGRKIFEESTGSSAQVFIDGITSVAPDVGPLSLEWELADAYGRKAIDLQTGEIVMLAACALVEIDA